MNAIFRDMYTSGEYMEEHPTWHIEDSCWKARQIIRMIKKNNLCPKAICEMGCGAGAILKQLQLSMDKDCEFWGYEISPQALELCNKRANVRLNFKNVNCFWKSNLLYDLILAIDLIEHLEDYFGFLRKIKDKSRYKIFHIPLDLSVLSVLRRCSILKVRESAGHIHYFTKEIALQVLRDTGYAIVDYFFTAKSIELPAKTRGASLAKFPRKLFFGIHKDLAARIMGGFSLMILAE